MKRVFVTFLGRGRDSKRTGYRTANYRFPDDSTHTTPFLGLALADYIGPERTLILGTASSQWGVLVENLAAADEMEEARLELLDAEESGTVTQAMLDSVTPLMEREVGCEVVPRLIPFGKDEAEQYQILEVIAADISEGEVDFDLTHGFRHFGMIGLLSAFMLARLQPDLTVKQLWYGALEMTENGITPVLRLDGLDRVRQWLAALNRFDATGNYRVFGALLVKDGVDKTITKHLENAAFHERTFNVSQAAIEIKAFRPVLETHLNGASGLFQERLAASLDWVDLETLSKQQAKLARQYLERRDYIRATILTWESLISEECEKAGLNPTNRQIRDTQNALRVGDQIEQRERKTLQDIRNTFAHAAAVNRSVEDILADEETLNETLKRLFKHLLP